MQATTPKTLSERIVHASLFEGIALLICSPVLSWVLDKSLFETGLLTIAIATCAMLWNMVYNAMFERVEARFGLVRTVPVRIVHAVLFELGLIIFVVLLASWWLSISLWAAFLLEMGLILFFLPYTYVYNLVYDRLRERRIARREAKAAARSGGAVRHGAEAEGR